MHRLPRSFLAVILLTGAFAVPATSSVSAATPPANDNRSGATVMNGSMLSLDQSTVGATTEPGEPLCEGMGATVWFRFTTTQRGIITASMVTGRSDGSAQFNPVIAMYMGSDPNALTRLGCEPSLGNAINIGGTNLPPATYWVQVGGINGQTGQMHIDIETQSTGGTGYESGAVVQSTDCTKTVLDRNDDGSSPLVPLGFTVNFYGRTYSQVYVNNNGNVTFDGPLSTYTPFGLTAARRAIIAPFFADVDTRGTLSDVVRYGYGATIYEGRPAFCVNWIGVGYYSGHTDKLNSFQLLLVDRGAGTFDIVFNYDSVQWETGDASGGSGGLGGFPARAGYSDGSGFVDQSYEIAGSGVSGAFLDGNYATGLARTRRGSAQNGRHVFGVRNGLPPCGDAGDFDCDKLSDSTERSLGTNPREPDTDGDGLLDSWEAPPTATGAGIHTPSGRVITRREMFGPYTTAGTKCSNTIDDVVDGDLRPYGQTTCLNHPPDPLVKDVYVEIDWQDCTVNGCPEIVSDSDDTLHHAPNVHGLQDAVKLFAAAPVVNTNGKTGVNLHVLVDERIAHVPNCDQAPTLLRGKYFGTAMQRGDAELMALRARIYRWAWSGHSTRHADVGNPCPDPEWWKFGAQGYAVADLAEYDLSPFGDVNLGGDTLMVSLGVLWNCPSEIGRTEAFPLMRGVLGPCFRETEKNLLLFSALFGIDPGIFPGQVQGKWYRHPIHRMMGENEYEAGRQLWSRSFTHLLGNAMGVDDVYVGNQPAPSGRRQSSHTSALLPLAPDSYGTWANLKWAPNGPGTALPQEEFPNYDELAADDPDNDNVPEGSDNCPGVYNPNQKNSDEGFLHLEHNTLEFGDACDPDIDGDGKRNVALGEGEVVAFSGPAKGVLVTSTGTAPLPSRTSEDPVVYDQFPYDTDDDGIDNDHDSDDDGDGVPDTADSCAGSPDADQRDTDGDGVGDACDPDADGDTLPNGIEVAAGSDPRDAGSTAEYVGAGTCANGVDDDGDGTTDAADPGCVDGDGDGVANADDHCNGVRNVANLDGDGDGIGDACELRVSVTGVSNETIGGLDTDVKVAFSATKAGTFEVRVGGTSCAGGTLVASGAYDRGTGDTPASRVVTIAKAALAEGENVVRACLTAAGETVDADTTIVLDTAAPAVSAPDLAATSDAGTSATDDLTNVALPVITGTAEPGALVTLYRDGDHAGDGVAGADGRWSITATEPDVERPLTDGPHTYAVRAVDGGGNVSAMSDSLTVTLDREPSDTTITGGTPAGSEVAAGTAVTVEFAATEPGTFTCALDDAAAQPCTSPYRTTASGGGTHTLTVTAVDAAGNADATPAATTWEVTAPRYAFTGFFSPVDSPPVVNAVKAGAAVPLKFSLGGDMGLAIFAAGSPSSVRVDCQTQATVDEIEATSTANSSGLTYDAAAGQYVYVWKTSSAWADTCRQLRMTLDDGTTRTATFTFR